MTTLPETAEQIPAARTLHAICEITCLLSCAHCWAGPQHACVTNTSDGESYHLARFAAAHRKNLLTEADMAVVLAVAGSVFTFASLVCDDTLGGAGDPQRSAVALLPDALRVQVTANDIEAGYPTHCWGCPVARAVRRTLGGGQVKVRVGLETIEAYQDSDPAREPAPLAAWRTPEPVQRFIAAFDTYGRVEPFTFTAQRVR